MPHELGGVNFSPVTMVKDLDPPVITLVYITWEVYSPRIVCAAL